jgi:hypothetical protein
MVAEKGRHFGARTFVKMTLRKTIEKYFLPMKKNFTNILEGLILSNFLQQ